MTVKEKKPSRFHADVERDVKAILGIACQSQEQTVNSLLLLRAAFHPPRPQSDGSDTSTNWEFCPPNNKGSVHLCSWKNHHSSGQNTLPSRHAFVERTPFHLLSLKRSSEPSSFAPDSHSKHSKMGERKTPRRALQNRVLPAFQARCGSRAVLKGCTTGTYSLYSESFVSGQGK